MTRVVDRAAGRRLRFTPILGKKVWFGPRGWGGWGWTPVSWEGWLVFAVGLGAIGVVIVRYGEASARPAVLAITSVLILICWIKGTSPGSARAKAEFDRSRRAGS